MKVRVLYRPDKSVSVVHPAPKSRREDETEEQWLERVFAKATPEGMEYDDVDKSEIPQSREDRGAWEGEKGKGITINQAKADALKEKKANEAKIENKMRELPIKELQKNGELPEDY